MLFGGLTNDFGMGVIGKTDTYYGRGITKKGVEIILCFM